MNKLYPSFKSALLMFLNRTSASVLVLTLAGCASNPVVLEADRDTTGKFDGVWIVTAEGRAGEQYSGNETLRCRKLDWRSYLNVQDGKGSAGLGYKIWEKSIYVNSDGNFNVSAKTGNSWSDNKTLVVNLQGTLADNTGSGYYTIGREPFYGSGCRYKAKFERSGS